MSIALFPQLDLEPAPFAAAIASVDAPLLDPVTATTTARGASPLLALALQLMRFGTVGVFGFVWDYATFTAFRPILGFLPAVMAAFLVACSMNWLLNRLWTFRGCRCGRTALQQWLAFLGANGFGFMLNRGTVIVLAWSIPFCFSHPVLALAGGSLAGLCANFGMSRRLVFRDAAPHRPA